MAISNRKGGTGKTTTAVNVAAALAHRGHRVLLVDIDPQAHATLSLGIKPGTAGGGVYALLEKNEPVQRLLTPTYLTALQLLPADPRLAQWERLHARERDKRTLLAERLNGSAHGFDYVIFDTPPVMGLLTVSALVASREVYVPMQTHFLALEGLSWIVRTIKQIDTIYRTGLCLKGVIPTFHNERTRLSKTVVNEITAQLGEGIVLHPVRVSIALAEAPGFGQSVFQYRIRSTGAQDYLILARQIERMSDGQTETN